MHVKAQTLLRSRIRRDLPDRVFAIDARNRLANQADVAGASFVPPGTSWAASTDVCDPKVPDDGKSLRSFG